MYRVGIIGATGVVGRKMLEVLAEYDLPLSDVYLFASKRSSGMKIPFKGKEIVVQELTYDHLEKVSLDFVLMAAGSTISQRFAPFLAKRDVIVVDNSSYFRMEPEVPLVIPEINFSVIDLAKQKIIANPNCSTIQSVLPLASIDRHFSIEEIDYVTYQAVSGSGKKGIEDLMKGEVGEKPSNYPYPIYHNVLPQIDEFLENGFTKEEMKMVQETQKILAHPELKISATCVRVPVLNGHSVAIRFTTKKSAEVAEIRQLLQKEPGIKVVDDPENLEYPMPLYVQDQDCIFVGRIRKDLYRENCFHLFTVGDNLRKGAASNAVQIVAKIIDRLEK